MGIKGLGLNISIQRQYKILLKLSVAKKGSVLEIPLHFKKRRG
jgi:hypothetical protein